MNSTSSKNLPLYLIKLYEQLRQEHLNDKSHYILELRNVDKIYENGFQAIFGGNFKLKKGEFLALLGPSGCGKSTTLRMIAGLEKISYGEIYIDKVNATNLEPSDRNLTMVFQNYALFPHLTVKNNIAFGLKANKKKLGEGGLIYKQIRYLKNQLKANENLISSVKNLPKSQQKIQHLQKQLDKHLTKKQKFQTANKLQALKKLEIEINTYEAVIEYSKQKVIYYKSMESQIQKLEQENKKIQAQITNLEVKRQAVAKNDRPNDIINKKVLETAKLLGLDYYLNRKPAALSGGQRQRVALGRSIVSSPFLFLMDEPLSNLDAKLRAVMRREIRALHMRINSGTVYVTHDQIEAMTMADKIAVMTDGFVLQFGSPSEIYKHPSCMFVAGFVGSPSMNFIEGRIEDNYFISAKGLKLPLTKDNLKHTQNHQTIVLGIRPTDFSIDDNFKEAYKPLQVKIKTKELLGNEIQYSAVIWGMKGVAEEITFITNSYENYQINSTQEIIPILSRIHLFDQTTTICLTSNFNFETLDALKNWIISDHKIQIRKELLEKSKLSSQKNWTQWIGHFCSTQTKNAFEQAKKLINNLKEKKK